MTTPGTSIAHRYIAQVLRVGCAEEAAWVRDLLGNLPREYGADDVLEAFWARCPRAEWLFAMFAESAHLAGRMSQAHRDLAGAFAYCLLHMGPDRLDLPVGGLFKGSLGGARGVLEMVHGWSARLPRSSSTLRLAFDECTRWLDGHRALGELEDAEARQAYDVNLLLTHAISLTHRPLPLAARSIVLVYPHLQPPLGSSQSVADLVRQRCPKVPR